MFKIPNISNLLVKHRVLWHIGFWLIYALTRAVPYYITVMYYDRQYLEFMLITEGSFVVLTYATIWLYKRLCTAEKYAIYGILSLGIWAFYFFLVVQFQKFYLRNIQSVAETEWWDIYLNNMTKYVVTLIVLTMAKYFKDNVITQYYENQRKQLQIQSELQNLKAQISPHFLFNTMNNFYGLAVEQSLKLPELMVRLSELLRYSLYETKNMTVPIVKEMNYLKNYIELEKIRLEDTLDFEFNTTIDEKENREIAPLIFIVFVENAFKHAKNVETDVVRIKINTSISNEGVLLFDVKNNCLINETTIDYNTQGIGLENVRKRLAVLYPNGLHQLHVKKTGNYFYVRLQIHLK
jgi:two-component system, LytTR family, sensor histidine kinase LytS